MAGDEKEEQAGRALVLASASPRRRELLGRLGVRYAARPVSVDERPLGGESPWGHARRVALLKLARARALWPGETILAADTVVDLRGVALGKPRGEEEAAGMLRALRGREHLVHTGVAVGRPGVQVWAVCTTRVWMRAYGDEEIAAYVGSGESLDKAGAYAIQDERFRPVERISGSYSNVVGLPLGTTVRLLRDIGIAVADAAAPEPGRDL